MSAPIKHKYRPYFSTEEMAELILCLKENPNPRRMGMIRYLETFNLKIERGIIGISLNLKPTLLERLELEDLPANTAVSMSSESLYNKWKLAPETCSPAELEKVMEYRYSKDLMSPQEEQEYEDSLGTFNTISVGRF